LDHVDFNDEVTHRASSRRPSEEGSQERGVTTRRLRFLLRAADPGEIGLGRALAMAGNTVR
jgi:hypothetical protein